METKEEKVLTSLKGFLRTDGWPFFPCFGNDKTVGSGAGLYATATTTESALVVFTLGL